MEQAVQMAVVADRLVESGERSGPARIAHDPRFLRAVACSALLWASACASAAAPVATSPEGVFEQDQKASPVEPRPVVRRDVNGFPEALEVPRREALDKKERAEKEPEKHGKPGTKEQKPEQANKPVALRLNGSGLCEYGIFAWDIYHAALYLEKPTRKPASAIDSEQHKLIVLRFCRSLSASQLRSAWSAAFKANAGKALAKYRAGLDRLNAWMKPIAKGEELRFIVRPGRGVEVIDRGVSRGEIRGDAWARMFVRLYLGDAPPDAQLKKGMLAGLRLPKR